MDVDLEEPHAQEGMRKVFDSFVDLVQQDYQNAQLKAKDGVEIRLNDDWKSRVCMVSKPNYLAL